jgi:hypothetical protein
VLRRWSRLGLARPGAVVRSPCAAVAAMAATAVCSRYTPSLLPFSPPHLFLDLVSGAAPPGDASHAVLLLRRVVPWLLRLP